MNPGLTLLHGHLLGKMMLNSGTSGFFHAKRPFKTIGWLRLVAMVWIYGATCLPGLGSSETFRAGPASSVAVEISRVSWNH